MIILVTALEPLLAIIFPDKAWDKRGVQHLKDFIQNCKRTIKALIEDLDLNELYKETKTVIDENIEDKFVVDAVTSAPQDNDPSGGNDPVTPFKSNRTQSTGVETA